MIRGKAMGVVDNLAKHDSSQQFNDDVAMRGRIEVEEGVAALRGGLRSGVARTNQEMGNTTAGEHGAGVGDRSQAG
jgi:hypothetical protein